jgi:hypothetical protein
MARGGVKGNRGGAKGRSGRKTKAEELELQALLDKCWTKAEREKCIRALAKTASDPLSNNRIEAVKILLNYCYGKPKETHELTGKNGGAIQTETTVIMPKP